MSLISYYVCVRARVCMCAQFLARIRARPERSSDVERVISRELFLLLVDKG